METRKKKSRAEVKKHNRGNSLTKRKGKNRGKPGRKQKRIGATPSVRHLEKKREKTGENIKEKVTRGGY